MKQSGGRRQDHAGYAQSDQACIKAYDKPVIAMDPFHQRITDLPEDHDLLQIISTDGDISDLTGDLRAVSDGDSHIGLQKEPGNR